MAIYPWIGGFVEGVIYGEAKEFLQVAQWLGVTEFLPSKLEEMTRFLHEWSLGILL